MTQPHLYLLHKTELSHGARVRAVEEMIAAAEANGGEGWKTLRNVAIVQERSAHARPEGLVRSLAHYPKLATMNLWKVSLPPCFEHVDLAVFLPSRAGGTELVGEAMAAGVPVLIPDNDREKIRLVRDGVNGFHYRAHSEESLALSLLALALIPQDNLDHIKERAKESARLFFQLGGEGKPPATTGESI